MKLFDVANAKAPERTKFVPKEGVYSMYIDKAEPLTSKAGRPMIKLTLNVSDHQGNKCGKVFEYMMTDSESEFCRFKNGQIMRAVGLDPASMGDEIEDGVLCTLLEKAEFCAHCTVEGNDQYGDRLRIDGGCIYNINELEARIAEFSTDGMPETVVAVPENIAEDYIAF